MGYETEGIKKEKISRDALIEKAMEEATQNIVVPEEFAGHSDEYIENIKMLKGQYIKMIIENSLEYLQILKKQVLEHKNVWMDMEEADKSLYANDPQMLDAFLAFKNENLTMLTHYLSEKINEERTATQTLLKQYGASTETAKAIVEDIMRTDIRSVQ